jgi:nucleotidyltransferase/DNA polymerase involved in DNA repair
MGFAAQEREALLALPGVGAAVVKRLEQLGYASLAELRGADVDELIGRIGDLTCSACWRKAPKARAAIAAVVALAGSPLAGSPPAPEAR